MILYHSKPGAGDGMSFVQALQAGIGTDGCDITPKVESPLPRPFFNNIAEMSSRDVAYVVTNAMMGSDFDAETLRHLVNEWITDDFELRQAGKSVYAFESLNGSTLSEYDLIGRLFAVLLRYLYDRRVVSIDTVFFSPSRGDSCAAISQAFQSVIGKSPVMIQVAGLLTEVEKRQLIHIVPHDMLYVTGCDEAALDRLSRRVKSMSHCNSIMIADCNPIAVVARVFMYFEAYRLLCIAGAEGKAVVCADSSNSGDVMAAQVAIQLGLPVRLIQSEPICDIEDAILRAYKESGYIVCPRSAAQWDKLHDNLREGESGIFIQHNHPAKNRFLLEPLLNRVIALPHKLHFDDVPHARYKRVAPSVNALKNCFINY